MSDWRCEHCWAQEGDRDCEPYGKVIRVPLPQRLENGDDGGGNGQDPEGEP